MPDFEGAGVDTRVRLTADDIAALDGALPFTLSRRSERGRVLIEGLEFVLWDYKTSREIRRRPPPKQEIDMARQLVKALRQAHRLLPDDTQDDRAKRELVLSLVNEWQAEVKYKERMRAFYQPAHREADRYVIGLAAGVAAALRCAGVEVTAGRDTRFVLVLRQVLQWADRIAGRKVLKRPNLHALATQAIATADEEFGPW